VTTYNQQFTLSQTGWTNIGNGPMHIELISFGVIVNVVVSDSQPAAGQLGEFLEGGTKAKLDVPNSSSVWAIIQPGAGLTAIIDVLSEPGGGISSNGSVGTSSAVVVAAGTFFKWVTIQNTHATQKLSLSFNTPATTADFTLAPGAAMTLPFGLAKSLYGIGSGAGTTFALIGF
jgi:hypothetical protein